MGLLCTDCSTLHSGGTVLTYSVRAERESDPAPCSGSSTLLIDSFRGLEHRKLRACRRALTPDLGRTKEYAVSLKQEGIPTHQTARPACLWAKAKAGLLTTAFPSRDENREPTGIGQNWSESPGTRSMWGVTAHLSSALQSSFILRRNGTRETLNWGTQGTAKHKTEATD